MAGTSKIRWRRDIEALAKERGWTLEPTNGGHYRLRLGHHVVIAPSSPRNAARTMANTLALMKRFERNVHSDVQ